MNTTASTCATVEKRYKVEYLTLFDIKILLKENIKSYSPLPVELLWEMYDKKTVIYELPMSATIIYKVVDKKTKKTYALKELRKERLKENYLHEFAKNESAIHYSMSKLSNLIVKVPHYFESQDSYYMVMEYSSLHGYFEELLEKVINIKLFNTLNLYII